MNIPNLYQQGQIKIKAFERWVSLFDLEGGPEVEIGAQISRPGFSYKLYQHSVAFKLQLIYSTVIASNSYYSTVQ